MSEDLQGFLLIGEEFGPFPYELVGKRPLQHQLEGKSPLIEEEAFIFGSESLFRKVDLVL